MKTYKKELVREIKSHAFSKLALVLTTLVPCAVISIALDPVHWRLHQVVWLGAYTALGLIIWHARNEKLRNV